MLMKIFATKEAAEADLPKWGNPVAPPHLFSVRELSDELESGARCNGCDSDDQRPRSADSLNRECDSPDQSQYEERLEMLKAMDADNDPTATTHLHNR
jgi:hypothetical protein